jgi:putative restriction endonuclease
VPLSFDTLRVGHAYDRPTLAKLWGYKSWSAIGKGVVTPARENVIVLFITKEKQQTLPQYQDTLDGGTLRMEGEDRHRSDERLINAANNGDDVHLFYRERHHAPFTYEGRVVLEDHQRRGEKPSRFVFRRAVGGETLGRP